MFVAVGIIAYVAALIWTIPAAVALSGVPAVVGTTGTVWRGSANLIDGSTLGWRWAPWRSLIGLGFAADWDVTGAGSELAGRALLRRHAVAFEDVRGSAAGSLLAIAAPGLPFVCGTPLRLALDRVVIGGSGRVLRGEVRSGSGSCAAKGGGVATIVPPMVLSLRPVGNSSQFRLAPLGARMRALLDGALSRDGRLMLRVTPEGAKALPFASPPGGFTIETTL